MVGLGILGLLGALGGGGRGAAQERGNQNTFNLSQDALRNSQYSTQQQALLQLLGLTEQGLAGRARLGLDAPGQRTRQAVLGSLLQNVQPFQVTPPPGVRMGNVSGGMSPALLNKDARAAGGELQRQALMALLTKSDVPPMPDTSKTILNPPQLSNYQRAGGGESILSLLGLIGSGLGAAGFGMGGGSAPQGWPPFMTPPYNPQGWPGRP